jgi:hypothetical protein
MFFSYLENHRLIFVAGISVLPHIACGNFPTQYADFSNTLSRFFCRHGSLDWVSVLAVISWGILLARMFWCDFFWGG